MDQEIVLAGIPIDVPNSRAYLEALFQVLNLLPFYSPRMREELALVLGNTPARQPGFRLDAALRVVGFVAHELIAVIDREWHDYDGNEGDRLFEYLSSRQLLGSGKTVFIWGAGSCRLADYLAAQPNVHSIICTDLSWAALYFGRALIQSDFGALPELLTRPRVFYDVDHRSCKLVPTTREARFKKPLTPPDRQQSIRYSVRNAFFAPRPPTEADLIVVPYLLDNFSGAQCVSLLVRICQHMKIGQQIAILMTCVPEGRGGTGRDPAVIVEELRKGGFSIEFLDLCFLPYSFSYYSYTRIHSEWNTLVLRAEKVADVDIHIMAGNRPDAAGEAHHQAEAHHHVAGSVVVAENRDLVLDKLGRGQSYSALSAALRPKIGAEALENVLGDLASRALLNLRFDAARLKGAAPCAD